VTATDLPAAAAVLPAARTPLRWLGTRSPLVRVTIVGSAVLGVAFLLTALDVAGQVVLWENLHWTIASVVAVILTDIGARQTTGHERFVRRLFEVSWATSLLGMVAWDLQVASGIVTVPAPSDIFFIGSALPAVAAFAVSVRGWLGRGQEVAAYLDSLAVSAAIGTIIAATYAPAILAAQPLAALVTLLYPIAFFTVAVFGIVTALALRVPPAPGGGFLISMSFAILALAWVEWLAESVTAIPPAGSPINYIFSVATVLSGWGGATWVSRSVDTPVFVNASRRLRTALPFVSVLTILVLLVLSEDLVPLGSQRLLNAGTALLVILVIARQAVLLRERDQVVARELELVEQERHHREETQIALFAQRDSQARYRDVVEVFARLAEQITFASEERDLVRAAMAALGRIVPSRHGDILLASPSQDRLLVGAAWGWQPAEAGSAAAVDSPLRCPGIRRGAVHSLENAADVLQLACPAHPSRSGSVLCVPMLALGQVVGVIHLGRSGMRAFSDDDQRQASRVAEQAALAISNLRLARTMEGMAMSDALTGVPNARFFDPYLERELASAARGGDPVGILMIDLDHFKDFNDRHGHPAGDDALRTFARTASSMLRASDTVARYGGEEFVVALRGADLQEAAVVAEKLRLGVEQMVLEVGPSRYARLTVSIGVASTSVHGTDRRTLVKVADQALYQAKQAGRNQVAVAPLPYRERRSSSAAGARLRGRGTGAAAGRGRAKKGTAGTGAGSPKTEPNEPAKARRKPPGTGRRDAA
jgi:diguanylate cyclase (GGDEF)-like protein